ncbi:Uncharacterized protein C1orf167 [Lemmus lemmus]
MNIPPSFPVSQNPPQQGPWRELAAHRAWNYSRRPVMGLWQQPPVRWWASAEESPGSGPGTGASGPEPLALLLADYFQAWCEHMRDIEASQDQHQGQTFQDDLRRGLGATLSISQEACRAGPLAQDWCVAQASVLGWSSFPQQCGTDRQLRKAQALGQCCEVRQQGGRRVQVLMAVQVALCWVLWVHESYLGQIHQAYAAQQLTTRNRHLQCRQIQASQQARCLARAWQHWVDVHWVEQLSRTLAFEKWYGRLVARSPGEEPDVGSAEQSRTQQ